MAAALASGCASPRRYYETNVFRTDAVKSSQKAALLTQTRARWAGRNTQIIVKGAIERLDLGRADLATLRALHAASHERYYGAEIDMVVTVDGQKRARTLRIDVDGSVVVEPSGRLPASPPAPTDQVLRRRFAMGPLTEKGRGWNPGTRAVLAHALALASASERQAVQGLPFVRSAGDSPEGGRYEQINCRASIHVYDRAFAGQGFAFTGGVRAPMPAAVRTMLHEFGHAIHAAPGRAAFCRAEAVHEDAKDATSALNAGVKRLNELVRAYNGGRRDAGTRTALEAAKRKLNVFRTRAKRLVAQSERMMNEAAEATRHGPILSAFDSATRGTSPVTRYARGSVAEHFVEAYALFRADPAALKRVNQAAYRFFEQERHVE